MVGLLGENGAGKTTLMNVLFGIYSADAGVIRIDGRLAAIHGPADALAAGIGMVHQHFHLVARHSVIENLMVGQGRPWGLCDRVGTRARLAQIGRDYGLKLDPERPVGELSVGEQQRLEIVKALFRGARILILDEPTSVLTPRESEGLFAALRAMTRPKTGDGVGIIFISHKLAEVRAIAQRLVVLRQGAVTAEIDDIPAVTDHRLAELMCGHDLDQYCFIGAGAVVTHAVRAHALMVGNPARQLGSMCRCGPGSSTKTRCWRFESSMRWPTVVASVPSPSH